MIEAELVDEVGVGRDEQPGLAERDLVVVDQGGSVSNLIEQVQLFLVVNVEDDQFTDALDEHHLGVLRVSYHCQRRKVANLHRLQRASSHRKVRPAGTKLGAFGQRVHVDCLGLSSHHVEETVGC